ncbi:MAG: PTS sugar transporter subunit IIC [bacterium]
MGKILTEALLVGAVGGVLNLDTTLAGQTMVSRPLVSSSITGAMLGIILKDFSQGFFVGLGIGALLELIWIATLPVGGSIPPNSTLAGITGVSLALLSQGDLNVIFALSIIFAVGVGIMARHLDTLERKIINQRFLHQAIHFAQEGKAGGIELVVAGSLFLSFLITFFTCITIVLAGTKAINLAADMLPLEVKNGLTTLKYLLPLLGLGVITENFLNATNWIYLGISFLLSILVISLWDIPLLWWLILFTTILLVYLRIDARAKSPKGTKAKI